MRVAERKLEASAHNTANASTDGFERLRTTAREIPSGVHVNSDTVELSDDAKSLAEQVDGPQNNVDQAWETVDRIESSALFASNARTLRTQDRLMQSLLDIFA